MTSKSHVGVERISKRRGKKRNNDTEKLMYLSKYKTNGTKLPVKIVNERLP